MIVLPLVMWLLAIPVLAGLAVWAAADGRLLLAAAAALTLLVTVWLGLRAIRWIQRSR